MFKIIQLISFCVVFFTHLSQSITTPLIVFNHEDDGIHYDDIQDSDKNWTIIVENSTKLYQTNYRIKSFDYDLEDKYFVWSSNEYPYPIWMSEFRLREDSAKKTRIQIRKRSIIALRNSQTKLTVDWVHNLVYFFKYQTLNVVHIDNPEVTYELTRKESPSEQWKFSYGNIAVNPEKAFLVWTEYNSIDGIALMKKCDSDGSNQKVLVYKDIRIPICIAIDFKTNSILWIDNELHSLSSIDYFGNNRKTLKQSKDLFNDCSSMDISDGYVYWSSPKKNMIQRTNISGNDTQEAPIETVVTSDSDIDFVKIISQSNQKLSKNYCLSANCSHICLPDSSEHYRCLCSDIPQLDSCNETQILQSSSKIPEQRQNTTAVSQLFQSGVPLLLFTASKRDIRLAKLPDTQEIHYTDSEFLYKLDSYVSTIEYSISGNFLVWLKTDQSIYTYLSKTILFGSPIDETVNNDLTVDSMKAMVNVSENSLLKTMAIDWVHNLVYFPICESTKGIFVANLSSPQVLYLIVPQIACVTKDVRVDPIESYLFWSEYHESSSGYPTSYRYSSYGSYRYRNSHSVKSMIKRSAQDGQNSITLVERQYIRKNSLTLDLEEKMVYWIDMNSAVNRLYRVDYNGNSMIAISPSTTLFEDFSSMDLFKDHIYWANTDDDTIRRVSKSPSTIYIPNESHKVLQSGVDIDALKIVDSLRQPNGTNKCLNHGCPHVCLPSSGQNNFTCFCPRGQVWNSTAQVCVFSSSRSYSQSTTTIATIRRTTTTPFSMFDNETKILFVVYKEGIYVKPNIYDLDTNYIESIELKSNNDWITELDFDFNDNYMLWLESSVFEGFSLYAAPIEKTRSNGLNITYMKKIISKTYNAKRLAFDWIHKLVYLSVPTGIEVFTLGDRVYNYDIVSHDEVQGDLALDPVEGLVFWSQWRYTGLNNHIGRIFRANQDGSGKRVLTSDPKIPNTLAVDSQSKTIYWIDTSLFSLHSIDYQGHNQTVHNSIRNLFDGSFSMDVFGDNIFWSNYDKNAILMTSKSGANASERIAQVNAYTDIEGIKVFDSSRQPNGTNRCLNTNCTDFQLCLPVLQGYRCVCSKTTGRGLCSENTQNVVDREMAIQSLPGTNPINSQLFSDDHLYNISKKLDDFHALLNDTVLNANKSETNHHWIAIVLISVAVNVILISFLIYRKKKMNPFSKYIMAKFKNDREEIFLDERVDDDI